MISVWDDLPLHQTPAVLAEPATSDPAAYERFFFACADRDGHHCVALVVTLHPNKGVLDAAFAVSDGERHESLFVTDRLGHARDDLACGPVRLTLTEPMRTLRIRVDADAGFAADLRFRAVSPAIEEERVTRRRAGRVVQDRTRYAQLGVVAGTVASPLGDLAADEQGWFAGRDHSWGIWDAPREHAADARDASPSFFWLIAAFEDRAVQAVTHADDVGRRYGEYAAVCPALGPGVDAAGPGAGQRERPVTGLDVAYPDGSWHFETATMGVAGEELELRSLHSLLPRAVGYGHPAWVPGTVHPHLPHVVTERIELRDEALGERLNHRALQVVRVTGAGGAVGHGVVDQCVSASRAAHARTTPARSAIRA